VPFFTWCGACKDIMVGLQLVIDCLHFSFLFSLLTIKVHNCSLFVVCLSFTRVVKPKVLGSGYHFKPKVLESVNNTRRKSFRSDNHVWCQTKAQGCGMVATTWSGSANASRPRWGSCMVVRPKSLSIAWPPDPKVLKHFLYS